MRDALAAFARLQLKFEVAIAGGHPRDGRLDRLGQRGSAQAGVQHHAGGVDDAVQPRFSLLFDTVAYGPLDPHI